MGGLVGLGWVGLVSWNTEHARLVGRVGRLVGRLGCWLVGLLVGWSVGWIVGWSVGWSVELVGLVSWNTEHVRLGWLVVGWLDCWLVGRSGGWIVGWSVELVVVGSVGRLGWLVELIGLVGWLEYWTCTVLSESALVKEELFIQSNVRSAFSKTKIKF